MQIAICDDDAIIASRIENLVRNCMDIVSLDTEVYLSGQEMMDAIEKGNVYQIYLLDVMMPQINGFDVANAIRQKDENALILFITSNREMMQQAFDVRAFNYLLKDTDDFRIEEVIRRAIGFVCERQSFFVYQKSSDRLTIRNVDIMYMESRRRKMHIVMTEDEDEFYDTMDHVLERLNPVLFCRIHKSYIVNLEHVKKLSGNMLFMNNHTILKVTQNYLTAFNAKYRNFVIRQMK